MRTLITAIFGLVAVASATLVAAPNLVEACAGLIGSNGAVNLGRTTTLAGYHGGIEHYITAFEFQGGGGEFGSLIPLPDVPSNIERGGAWTLQRLQLETNPPVAEGAQELRAASFDDAEVLQQVRIDALDLTVLRGGGASVATWAQEHGFRLSPDAPEVLDFYARRSPIFLAAVFDGNAAAERGQQIGDGTPIHLTIPTDNPWVPLRILSLGKQAEDLVEADVFLLTDDKPALLPLSRDGLSLTHSDEATELLLNDLRSDEGMAWVPQSAWLTKLEIDSPAADLRYDLAVDTSGLRLPSTVDAGLQLPSIGDAGTSATSWVWAAGLTLAVLVLVALRMGFAGAVPWRAR
jgi:hypothetical protein